MRYGFRTEDGFLPVYSVADEREARALLVICDTNARGEYVARELVHEQTFETLRAFSDRLHAQHERLVARGACRCRA